MANAKAKAKAKTKAKTKRPSKGKRSDTALLDRLVQEAKAARLRAYAPYSKYLVGAAIATKSGNVYTGCNVENASYGATICAERGAIMQMVAAGERDPIACAVVTSGDEPGSPCGICRQVLAEFAQEMPIALVALDKKGSESGRVLDLTELLPHAFKAHLLR